MTEILIKKLSKDVNLPKYETEGSSGLDLAANIDKQINNIHIIEPNDYLIERRLVRECNKNNIKLNLYDSPAFISSKDDLKSFFKEDKVKFFQTSFYKAQRKKFNILLSNGDPKGGKWTYDDENRLKYPKDKKTPHIEYPVSDNHHSKAIKYVNENFGRNIGVINRDIIYPFTFNYIILLSCITNYIIFFF